MAGPRIKSTGKKLLREASRDAIGAYIQNRSINDRKTSWLKTGNRYRVSCVHQYSRDTKASPSAVVHQAMVDYVAASCPGHVLDGWSLLGRAVDALLRNDVYSAIHLGYYAELRAAMALLGAEGVGILSDRHPIVDKSSLTTQLPKLVRWDPRASNGAGKWVDVPSGTHAIVWPCLRHWASLAKSFQLIDEVFRPANQGLEEWLTRLQAPVSAKVVASRWIMIWGVDLSIVDDDHDSRNLVSYRPGNLRPPTLPSTHETLSFVSDLWSHFEPANVGYFPKLERHLVRRALQIGQVTLPLQQGALDPLGITGGEEDSWLEVLNSPDEPLLFSEADNRSRIEERGCHFQVLSRAALLLNLATAATRRLLREAAYSKEDLQFWWLSQGVDRGIWEHGVDTDPLAFWADILDSLWDVQTWLDNNPTGTGLANWRKSNGQSLNFLGALELVGIWGLIP